MDEELRWKTNKEKTLFHCKIFDLACSERVSAHNVAGSFFILNAPDWATVIPLLKNTEDEESFVLVKQFRHGVNKNIYEFPAGIVEQGENPEQTASRELMEETGYMAEKLTLLGKIHPCPSFMTNTSYTYLADNVTLKGKPELDTHELLKPVIMSVQEVSKRIYAGDPEFSNSQTLVSFFWFQKYVNKNTFKNSAS